MRQGNGRLLRNIGDNSLTEEVKGVLLRTKTKETMRPMLQGRENNIMKRNRGFCLSTQCLTAISSYIKLNLL